MTSEEFVIWMKGFVEACNEFHPTPKQWDRIKEVLNDINDYTEQPRSIFSPLIPSISLTGSISTAGGHGAITTTTDNPGTTKYTATVWNDKMGNWHYTNHSEGFGYYNNKKDENE